MFVRRRLAVLLATMTAAFTIGVPAASASAAPTPVGAVTTQALPPLPGPIQLPNAECPIWVGLNIIPVGCVPWAIIISDQLQGRPF
jgi:hypothetical protein